MYLMWYFKKYEDIFSTQGFTSKRIFNKLASYKIIYIL